jgi:hypothetical protein
MTYLGLEPSISNFKLLLMFYVQLYFIAYYRYAVRGVNYRCVGRLNVSRDVKVLT